MLGQFALHGEYEVGNVGVGGPAVLEALESALDFGECGVVGEIRRGAIHGAEDALDADNDLTCASVGEGGGDESDDFLIARAGELEDGFEGIGVDEFGFVELGVESLESLEQFSTGHG